MSFIDLGWDASTKLFRLPILIAINIASPTGSGMARKFAKAIFYLDTGSGISSLTDEKASELGIDYNSLPTEQIAGIGGFTQGHILTNVEFIVLIGNDTKTVTLPKINVIPSEISKKVEVRQGVYKKRGTSSGKMMCLLGLDYLEAIRGEVCLNFVNKKGTIKF